MKKECQKCRHYKPQFREWGYCHESSPQIHATEVNQPDRYWSGWPSTVATQSCGKFRRAWLRSQKSIDQMPTTAEAMKAAQQKGDGNAEGNKR